MRDRPSSCIPVTRRTCRRGPVSRTGYITRPDSVMDSIRLSRKISRLYRALNHPWEVEAHRAGACAARDVGEPRISTVFSRETHLSHLELDSAHGLAIRNGKIGSKSRMAHDGRERVPVLVGKPLTDITVSYGACHGHAKTYYLVRSACPRTPRQH